MRRKDIIIGEDYLVRLPVNANVRWRGIDPCTVLSNDEPLLTKKSLAHGIKVSYRNEEYIVASRDVVCTWESHLSKQEQRKQDDGSWETWNEARENEIANAHLTMCATLQSLGHNIPDELSSPRDSYTLTPEQIVRLVGGNQAAQAECVIRSMHLPKAEPTIPTALPSGEQMRRMFVLGKLQECVNHLKARNEEGLDIGHLLGSSTPVLGIISETATTASVIRACEPMAASRVRKELTVLGRCGYAYSMSTGGWRMTEAGTQSLLEQ